MDGDEWRTIDVVQQANFTDSFQRSNEYCFGQDSKTDAQANIDRFDHVVSFLSESFGNTLSHHDRGRFTVMFCEEGSNIICNRIGIQMLNQQFLSTASEIVGTRNLNEWFRIETKLSSLFSDSVCMIGMVIENLLVSLHFFLKSWNIDAYQRIEVIGRCFV